MRRQSNLPFPSIHDDLLTSVRSTPGQNGYLSDKKASRQSSAGRDRDRNMQLHPGGSIMESHKNPDISDAELLEFLVGYQPQQQQQQQCQQQQYVVGYTNNNASSMQYVVPDTYYPTVAAESSPSASPSNSPFKSRSSGRLDDERMVERWEPGEILDDKSSESSSEEEEEETEEENVFERNSRFRRSARSRLSARRKNIGQLRKAKNVQVRIATFGTIKQRERYEDDSHTHF